MKLYTDEEMLMLSGVQHYAVCPRQWGLSYVGMQWEDNRLTAEGTLLHSRVDNPRTRRRNASPVVTLRGLRLASHTLGVSGIADAVELTPFPGAPHGKEALINSRKFTALPIEYKRGKRKTNDCDRLQVTAQAMILEEMLGISIEKGAVFYWEERLREYFDITPQLRTDVRRMFLHMHEMMRGGIIPAAQKKPCCRSCSLIDLCIPAISGKSVDKYLEKILDPTDD